MDAYLIHLISIEWLMLHADVAIQVCRGAAYESNVNAAWCRVPQQLAVAHSHQVHSVWLRGVGDLPALLAGVNKGA